MHNCDERSSVHFCRFVDALSQPVRRIILILRYKFWQVNGLCSVNFLKTFNQYCISIIGVVSRLKFFYRPITIFVYKHGISWSCGRN